MMGSPVKSDGLGCAWRQTLSVGMQCTACSQVLKPVRVNDDFSCQFRRMCKEVATVSSRSVHAFASTILASFQVFSCYTDSLTGLQSFQFNKRTMKLYECWLPLLLCLLLLGCPPVIGDDGSDYLDLKEQQLERLVNQSIINDSQKCELLATCSNPTNYSHYVCAPLLGDKDGLKCMVVNSNKYCSLSGTSNTTCTNMNLDYRQGYVRLAESTNLKSVNTMLSICSQRALDPLMKEFALLNPSILTRHFFAQIDGTWRVLPGSAQSGDDCRRYDPRPRPWYRTATSVMKVVVVLIDLAASMNNNLPPDLGAGTMLQAAKNIATQLLMTLSAGDHVNIIVFDSTRVIQLAPSAVLVQEHNTTEQLELDPLRLELSKQTVETQYRKSDLSGAILAALPNFDSNPQAAKVILVITDGLFATLGNVTLPSVNLTSVKVFLYKLPQSDDNDIYLAGNTLIRQLCAVGGHFEPILKNLENPLLALHKFFSYLANLKRILTGGRPQYGYVYKDFEQIGGNIITVTKPVFSETGDLIGAAGITIYIELLGSLTDQVKQELRSRITASGYNASAAIQVVLTAANCSIVNETVHPCGGSSNAYYDPNGGLCLKTDMTSTIQDLACCGGCSARNGSDNSQKLAGKVIAGIVVGSLVGLVGLAIVGLFTVCGYRKWKKARDEMRRIPDFTGPPDDDPIPDLVKHRSRGDAESMEMQIRIQSTDNLIENDNLRPD